MLKFAEGSKPEKESNASTTSYKGIDAFTEITNLLTGSGNILERIFSKVNEKVGFEAILNATRELDQQSADLVKALGVGSKRSEELIGVIADTIPDIVGMGLEAKTVFDTYNDVIDTFDSNIILSKESIKDLAATTKVTGVSTKELAEGFRGVGISISLVGDNMVDVAKIANQAGVTVSSVSDGVVKNLDKMNLYNFEGGVKGLAKMAAQASRLGIDMTKVFEVTAKVFNPDGAIDLAASLQRLGVASSELLDPLRLMDLAQNDPTELQNQIVSISKDFTRFNEQTKSFEILPGAKRRMKEVGEALGMTGGEFQKMALNAANFDMKLKQIKFSPDVKDEDRELVATMAQFNKGGVAEVKIQEMRTNEKGEQEWTGEYITKAVGDLKTDDIENLKKSQELQGKSMEEIAFDQLSEQKKLNSSIDKFLTTIQYGAGSYKGTQELYKKGLGSMTKAVKGKTPTVSEVRKTPDDVNNKLKGYGIDLEGGLKGLNDMLTTLGGQITSYVNNTVNGSISVNDFEIRTLPQDKLVMAGGTNIDGSKNSNTSSNTGSNEVNMTHTFNFSNLPSYVTSTEVERILKEYTQNSQNALAMVKAAGKVNNGLTS